MVFATLGTDQTMACSERSKKLCGKVSCAVCVPRSFAGHPHAAEWSPKNPMKAHEVLKSSNKKYWFDCAGCGHELVLPLNRIDQGGWCAYCNRGKLCDDEKCTPCFENSMASHPMGAMWSLRNEKTARQVSRGNDNKYWFQCSTCAHDFHTVPYSMTKEREYCPFCTHQKLCDDECKSCLELSCANHDRMAVEWSPKNKKTPRQVFLQSNQHYEFDCRECHHTFRTSPNHVSHNGSACPYCAHQRLCPAEDCTFCFQNSFASDPRMSCWSPKNTLNPRMTFRRSDKKAIFDCDVCHSEFDIALSGIARGWCRYCIRKSESKVLAFLQEEHPACRTEIRYDWCRFSETNRVMPFDFGLEDMKVLIELDGAQHFEQVSNWEAPERVQAKDIEKMRYAVAKGYTVIHIYQVEVWEDEYNWKAVLTEQIKRVEAQGAQGAQGTQGAQEGKVIFISRKEVYGAHIEGLGVAYEVIQP